MKHKKPRIACGFDGHDPGPGGLLVRGAINPPPTDLPRFCSGRRDRDHSICERTPGSPYSAPAGWATHPSGLLETAPAGFSESARSIEGKGKRRTAGAMRRFRGRTGLGGIRASGSRPIHQRRCGVLVPWRCPVLTQRGRWCVLLVGGHPAAPAVKAAGRASERNDILPRLAIARHPQLMTDKSAVSPLNKIALKSIPGGRAKRMECSVHNLPPTRAAQAKPNLLCCNVCDVRHKNHSSEFELLQAF